MKKVLLTVLFSAALLSNVNAQKVKIGVKGGLNISSLKGNKAGEFFDPTQEVISNPDSRIGFHIGAVIDVKITNKFSVQPEVLYSTNGATIQDYSTIKLDYLSLPISAKYYLIEGFSIEAGPQFSFLVNDVYDYENKSDLDTDAENFDLGINVGLGYELKSGLFLQSRYTFGASTLSSNPVLRNGNFQLSLGYQF